MKAWPDAKLRSIGRQYSSLTCHDFSHFFRITMVWRQLGITQQGRHARPKLSFPRKRESSIPRLFWIPACAGMTGILTASSKKKRGWRMKARPDAKLRSIGSQYSSLTYQDFSHFFVSRRFGRNLV
jgi:hypothetical protein